MSELQIQIMKTDISQLHRCIRIVYLALKNFLEYIKFIKLYTIDTRILKFDWTVIH